MTHTITLERNSFGQLVFVAPDGTRQQVNPVRSFPIAAPTEGIGLVNTEGEEVAWITRIADLSPASREVLEADLSTREFMPVIERIRSVSSFATVSYRGEETSIAWGQGGAVSQSEQAITTVDVGATWQATQDLSLSLVGYNLTNQVREQDVDSDYSYAEDGRRFWVKANYTF